MSPRDHDSTVLLKFSIATAQRAGELARTARLGGRISCHYKHGIELVSAVDEAVNTFIHGEIAQRYPQDVVLSEEGDSHGALNDINGPLWIVDPIDGTVNLVHGQDCVAICIAYAERGTVQAGVVHAPFRGETFTAVQGHGAWRNGVPIHTSSTNRLRDALIGTGFPHDRSDLEVLVRRLTGVLRNCQDIRRSGSPALDMCLVADGRLDGFYEKALFPWDVAAAALIAREAGAAWGHLHSVPSGASPDLYGQDVLVTTPGIFAALAALLVTSD